MIEETQNSERPSESSNARQDKQRYTLAGSTLNVSIRQARKTSLARQA